MCLLFFRFPVFGIPSSFHCSFSSSVSVCVCVCMYERERDNIYLSVYLYLYLYICLLFFRSPVFGIPSSFHLAFSSSVRGRVCVCVCIWERVCVKVCVYERERDNIYLSLSICLSCFKFSSLWDPLFLSLCLFFRGKGVCVCVCMCACVWVSEWERESVCVRERMCVCVRERMCVCVRESIDRACRPPRISFKIKEMMNLLN